MPTVEEQLGAYFGRLADDVIRDVGEIDRTPARADRSRRRRRRPLTALVAAATAVVVLAIGFAVLSDDGDRGPQVVAGPGDGHDLSESGGVFSERTDTVLVLSDGIDGVLAIDLDRRVVGRRAVEGERAGDQDFRLTLTQDHLVVGWGEIYAAPLSGGPAKLIGDSTVYIPASEPGQVWLLDYAGGRLGQGTATLQRVTLDGDVQVETQAYDPERHPPVIGVPGGLAVRTSDGMAIFDPNTGQVGAPLGPVDRLAAAGAVTNGEQLIWCADDGCKSVETAPLSQNGEPTPPHRSVYAAPVLAPNGARVAVLGRTDQGKLALRLIDAVTGVETLATSVPNDVTPDADVMWSPDGTQLFLVNYSYGSRDGETLISRYDLVSDEWETASIPAVGSIGGIALRPDQVQSFLPGEPGDRENCKAVVSYPSGREGLCGFRF